MAKSVLHVVPSGDGWAVKKEGVERPASTHDTQKNAIDAAREAATEGDEIVVHRTDGTIRDHTTYVGSNGTGSNRTASEQPQAHDIWSTGTRIHWSPVLAGIVTALAVSALLTALAGAIGLTATNNMEGMSTKAVAIIAGFTWMVIMIASLIFGGYVATRLTTRETKFEALLIGILVWGGTAALTAAGLTALGNTALNATRTASSVRSEQPFWEQMGLSEERMRDRVSPMTAEERQRYDEMTTRAKESARQINPQSTAWWTFFGMAMSLVAAMAGALFGAGPEVTRTDLRDDVTDGTTTPASRQPVTV